RELEAGRARRETCERIRAEVRARRGPDYSQGTAAWRRTLLRLVDALEERCGVVDIALAMIRGGYGTEGFCPLLIAAALDLVDEEQDEETTRCDGSNSAWESTAPRSSSRQGRSATTQRARG